MMYDSLWTRCSSGSGDLLSPRVNTNVVGTCERTDNTQERTETSRGLKIKWVTLTWVARWTWWWQRSGRRCWHSLSEPSGHGHSGPAVAESGHFSLPRFSLRTPAVPPAASQTAEEKKEMSFRLGEPLQPTTLDPTISTLTLQLIMSVMRAWGHWPALGLTST